MKFTHHIFAALCAGGLLLAPASLRAEEHYNNDNNDDERVSLGVAVVERDGKLKIAHVIKDTPADEAGLERGDEIKKVDGERVRTARDFVRRLQEKEEGDEIELEVTRDGDTDTIDIELASYRDTREAMREDEDFRRRAREAGTEQQLSNLRRQVQDLQRQVRQLQSQVRAQQQDRGPQRRLFDQQRAGRQQFDQQRDGRQQQFGQQRDDRQQQFGQQRDDRQQQDRFDQQRDDRDQQFDRRAGQQRGGQAPFN